MVFAKDLQQLKAGAKERVVRVRKAGPGSKAMRWVSLHGHSTFSYLDATGLPLDHAQRVADLGGTALALTEHGNIASHVKLEVACAQVGIAPIFGCEFYCSPGRTQRKYHLTVLAESLEGYRNLLALTSYANGEGFYYEPTISGDSLREHRSGLVVLSGCLGSHLACSLVGGKLIEPADASFDRARATAKRYKRTFGDNYFLEVQAFPELADTRRINKTYARLSKELGIPLVATMDVHYPDMGGQDIQKILHNVRGGGRQTLEEQVRDWGYKVPLCIPSRDSEIVRRLVACGLSRRLAWEAVANAEALGQHMGGKFELPKLDRVRFPLPAERGLAEVWDSELKAGWAYRGFDRLRSSVKRKYIERMRHECRIIEDKDYLDYFLIVSDTVRFAKDSGIPVGPARGSAAASLVAYVLRITEVNPMDFPNLIFERFIDETREDPPDIDLDFASDGRQRLRDYLAGLYGEDCVGNLGTFTYYKSRLALDDVARVYKVPSWEVEKVKDVLIERSSGDLRASATIEDTVEQFEEAKDVFERYPDLRACTRLEGMVKGEGVHAAGMVVANGPIREVAAILRKKVAGVYRDVICLDKYDAERQGLLKMDFLGLSTMSAIEDCLHMTGMSLEDLYKIDLTLEDVIDGFRRNDVVGIFQFDGRATRLVCGSIKPDNFAEIADVNALSRPGPLHNGAAEMYADIKRGVAKPERLHPLLDAITEPTYFQIVYQEQILRIVREIGGFSWTHAAYIRKIISKKLGDQEFMRQWETFRDGARERDVPDDVARQIWEDCTTSGSYAFNAAHSVSYGMLAYWTMFFKQRYPDVFYTAALRNYSPQKANQPAGTYHLELLRDSIRGNEPRNPISVLPPDPVESGSNWMRTGVSEIRAGLSQVPGIGEKTAEGMISWRSNGGAEQIGLGWSGYTAIKGIGPKTIEKIDEFCGQEDPFGIYALVRKLESVRGDLGRLGLPYPSHTAAEVPYDRGKDIAVTWCGVVLSRNLRDLFESNARRGNNLDPEKVKRPDLREWVIMLGEDETDRVSIYVDRWRYPRFREMVWKLRPSRDVILVRGVKRGFRAAKAIYANQMWVLDPDD